MVSLSQCVNIGKISADAAGNVGGIIGHLQQFGFVADCLNTGAYGGAQSRGGGLVGRSDSQSEVQCCLSIGDQWASPFCNTSRLTSLSDVLFMHEAFPNEPYDSDKCIYLDQLCLPFYYPDSWHFWDAFKTWSTRDIKGYFPVPNSCKMQASSYK